MGDSDALVAAVLDNPNDDAPILVLCDWLDERGDRRGTLLRRYFRRSRRERGEREAGLRSMEETFADCPAGDRSRSRSLDLCRVMLGNVEWRLVGWFTRHFPTECIRAGMAIHNKKPAGMIATVG